jgi:hypothetical protein
MIIAFVIAQEFFEEFLCVRPGLITLSSTNVGRNSIPIFAKYVQTLKKAPVFLIGPTTVG